MVVLTHPVGLSRSVTSRPPKAVLLLQIEIIRPGMRLPSQSVTDRADIHAKMLQIEMFGDRDKKPAPVWWFSSLSSIYELTKKSAILFPAVPIV